MTEVSERMDKVLVFTQFQEMTSPLARFLEGLFGRAGRILHGGTPVKDRKQIVQEFQEDETVPFMVLSLKAGGTGLNLTAANHVVHFDRWWNPAVEDQATDRAFRIGQRRNVLVHKFVCIGTLEEKIQQMLEDKQQISREILEGGGELSISEMGDAELLELVSLDIKAMMDES
jgi:SNF2 family DNA or RNA helicase